MNTVDERFDSKWVEDPETGCHEWVAGGTRGYGAFKLSQPRRQVFAHRFAYERARGPIPEGRELHHVCVNRACVNPDHLEVVTRHEHPDNIAVIAANKTHCPSGHPYDDVNTYAWHGARFCRACQRARDRKRRPRKKVG